MIFSKFGISCPRRDPLLRLGRWPPNKWNEFSTLIALKTDRHFGGGGEFNLPLLVELPSWVDVTSPSSSIDLWLPPSPDIRNDEIRSFNRPSNSPGISTSSLLPALRLRSYDPFGGSSSMKPPAHNGHVYSWWGEKQTRQIKQMKFHFDARKISYQSIAFPLQWILISLIMTTEKALTEDTFSISTLHLWQ